MTAIAWWAAVQAVADPTALALEFDQSGAEPRWLLVVANDVTTAVVDAAASVEASGVMVLDLGADVATADICTATADSTVVIAGRSSPWTKDDHRRLELRRDQIRTQVPQLLLITTPAVASALAQACPNFASYLLADTRRWFDGLMTKQQVEKELEALRETYRLTDAEVITLAEAGTIDGAADFATWLILLGRGDLLPSLAKAEDHE